MSMLEPAAHWIQLEQRMIIFWVDSGQNSFIYTSLSSIEGMIILASCREKTKEM